MLKILKIYYISNNLNVEILNNILFVLKVTFWHLLCHLDDHNYELKYMSNDLNIKKWISMFFSSENDKLALCHLRDRYELNCLI